MTGKSNTYEIIKYGKHRLLHQTPWFEKPGGEVAELIEIGLLAVFSLVQSKTLCQLLKAYYGHPPSFAKGRCIEDIKFN